MSVEIASVQFSANGSAGLRLEKSYLPHQKWSRVGYPLSSVFVNSCDITENYSDKTNVERKHLLYYIVYKLQNVLRTSISYDHINLLLYCISIQFIFHKHLSRM